MSEPGLYPEGYSVDAVDWLPSGAKSGLVRVRGHRPAAVAGPLPELILETEGEMRRFVSLPDPRADRDPSAWRGAYVLEARPAAEADRLWLEWPGQRKIALPALTVPEHQIKRADEAPVYVEPAPELGGEVVDRAVMAERRARRAEASEQAQARISREALRAVEVLELRIAELEQISAGAVAERDTLRSQASESEPDVRLEILHAEVRQLRAALAEREAAPVAVPVPAQDGDRRAERLRSALTSTVATVADLRMRLHEAEVARRTRDVARAADAVRLEELEARKNERDAEMDAAREGLKAATATRDEATAALSGAQAARDDLQARFADLSAELGAARERIADLESEQAALEAEASRAQTSAADAARADDEIHGLRARLARAEASIAAAETARELAEASALAAAASRQAAEVAHAAGSSYRPSVPDPGAAAARAAADAVRVAAEAAAAIPDPEPRKQDTDEFFIAAAADGPPAPRASDELIAAAAEQVRHAAEAEPANGDDSVVADLDAARAALRAKPTIVSAPADPPGDVARGRDVRDYPPLRGALVKLAHDDPTAAGQILAGLLPAQHAVLQDAPDYDLTIEGVGTFAVSGAGKTTLVTALNAPRGRPQATFHLRADPLTLAETLAGVDRKVKRRRGPIRASGKTRAARKLTDGMRGDVSLTDLIAAGAVLDHALMLRGLAYAARPAWTQGQEWSVEVTVADKPVVVSARHNGGLQVAEGAAETEPDARLMLSEDDFKTLAAGGEPVLNTEGDDTAVRRLLSLAERARTGSE